jgi:hypothetical protein
MSCVVAGSKLAFWMQFADLASASPDLLTVVCKFLSRSEREALRGVNRCMRVAMNASVLRLRCNPDTPPTHGLLYQTFRNVTSLTIVNWSPDSCLAEQRKMLQHMTICNQNLLSKLKHLSLTISTRMAVTADINVVWALLSRHVLLARACAGQSQVADTVIPAGAAVCRFLRSLFEAAAVLNVTRYRSRATAATR